MSIKASDSLFQPIHSDRHHLLELLFVKQRMPHLLHVYRCFVLCLALLLEIEGSEWIDDLVYSTLKQDIGSLEMFIEMFGLFDSVENDPYGAGNVPSIIVEFVRFDHFFHWVSCGIIIVLGSQF